MLPLYKYEGIISHTLIMALNLFIVLDMHFCKGVLDKSPPTNCPLARRNRIAHERLKFEKPQTREN